MRFLRSNTAVIVTVGPFYDKADGVTIEGSLTITNERITLTADTDAGSAPTIILDNVTGATSGTANDLNYITGMDAGLMQLELAAADVNRVGRMFLSITDAANHVPVFHEFFVLPQAIYDWLTGVIVPLPANVTTWLGTAAATPTVAGVPEVDLTHVAGSTTSVSTVASSIATLVTVVGALADAAADGDVTTADTLMQYVKQIVNTLVTTVGIPTFPAAAVAGNGVSLAEVIRSIDSRLPAALTAGSNIKADALAVNGSTAAAAELGRLMLATHTATFAAAAGTGPYTLDLTSSPWDGTDDDRLIGSFVLITLESTGVPVDIQIIDDYDESDDRITVANVREADVIANPTNYRYHILLAPLASQVNVPRVAEAIASGTIGATGNDTTHLHLAGQAYADDAINDHLIKVLDVSTGLYYTTWISDWANTGDLATVDTLPFTPEASVDRYWVQKERQDVTGGSGPTAADIADAVWDEDATAHQTTGTFGQAIGDPASSTETLYKAIVTDPAGTNLAADVIALKAVIGALTDAAADGAVTSTDTAVAYLKQIINTLEGTPGIPTYPAAAAPGNAVSIAEAVRGIYERLGAPAGASVSADIADLPTNAELATALGTADDAVLSAISTLQASVTTIDDILDTEFPALVTAVADLPTNAELATALGTADDAVLAAIATLQAFVDTEVASILSAVDTEVAAIKAKTDNLPSDPADASDIAAAFATLQAFVDTEVASILAAVDTEVAAIKAKTDSLTFTVANVLDANIQRINDVTIVGDGSGTPFNV